MIGPLYKQFQIDVGSVSDTIVDLKAVNRNLVYFSYLSSEDLLYHTFIWVFSENNMIKEIKLDNQLLIPSDNGIYAIVDNQIKQFSIDYTTGEYSIQDMSIPITIPYVGEKGVIPRWVGNDFITVNINSDTNDIRYLYKVHFDTGTLELIHELPLFYSGGIGRTTTNNAILAANKVYTRTSIGDSQLTKLTKDGKDYLYQSTTSATANDIRRGVTAYSNGERLIGSMIDNGSLNYTPSTEAQTIPMGYTAGGTIIGDANLLPENIKSGVEIFGVVGTYTGENSTEV